MQHGLSTVAPSGALHALQRRTIGPGRVRATEHKRSKVVQHGTAKHNRVDSRAAQHTRESIVVILPSRVVGCFSPPLRFAFTTVSLHLVSSRDAMVGVVTWHRCELLLNRAKLGEHADCNTTKRGLYKGTGEVALLLDRRKPPKES